MCPGRKVRVRMTRSKRSPIAVAAMGSGAEQGRLKVELIKIVRTNYNEHMTATFTNFGSYLKTTEVQDKHNERKKR